MANCQRCGAVVHWRRTPHGKAIPLEDQPSAEGRFLMVEGKRSCIIVDPISAARIPDPLFRMHVCMEDDW